MTRDLIIKAIKLASGSNNFDLEFPDKETFGDYSTNVALILAKEKEVSPRELADEIISKLDVDPELNEIVEKMEVAGPGFINFWLTGSNLVNELKMIQKEGERYGMSESGKGKTAIVEYSSPNIAKPFTVGHLRSTIIGDAIANLLEATGWNIMRDNHLGDWGTQFGKMIYAIKTWGDEDKIAKSVNPVKDLVFLYVKFHEEAEKDPSLEQKAREWFKKLENGDKYAREIWKKCIDWSFIEFDRIYKVLGVKFSKEFEEGRGLGESFFESRMKAVLEELRQKKFLMVGEEGAELIFFEKDKYPPLMIVKKDGTTLYATRDLATDKYRLEKYNPDLIINEVGSEQTLYFRQIFEVEQMLGWFKLSQRVHVGHGLIRFKEGKMSTRKGNVILAEDLLGMAVTRAGDLAMEKGFDEKNKIKSQHIVGGKSKREETTKDVAIGAIKYNDLKRDASTDIIFDWDEILNMEGNSGPYLQYTVARTNSVLAKSANLQISKSTNKQSLAKSEFGKLENDKWQMENEELLVLRSLSRFPEIISSAAKTYSPNMLCNYLYDLASKFNTLYNKHKIIGSDNEEFRLALTAGTGQVLKNGLKLLGIEAPERM